MRKKAKEIQKNDSKLQREKLLKKKREALLNSSLSNINFSELRIVKRRKSCSSEEENLNIFPKKIKRKFQINTKKLDNKSFPPYYNEEYLRRELIFKEKSSIFFATSKDFKIQIFELKLTKIDKEKNKAKYDPEIILKEEKENSEFLEKSLDLNSIKKICKKGKFDCVLKIKKGKLSEKERLILIENGQNPITSLLEDTSARFKHIYEFNQKSKKFQYKLCLDEFGAQSKRIIYSDEKFIFLMNYKIENSFKKFVLIYSRKNNKLLKRLDVDNFLITEKYVSQTPHLRILKPFRAKFPYFTKYQNTEFYCKFYSILKNRLIYSFSVTDKDLYRNFDQVNYTELSLDDVFNDIIWKNDVYFLDEYIVNMQNSYLMVFQNDDKKVKLKYVLEFPEEIFDKVMMEKRFELVSSDLGKGVYLFQGGLRAWGYLILNCRTGKIAFLRSISGVFFACYDPLFKSLFLFRKGYFVSRVSLRKEDMLGFF